MESYFQLSDSRSKNEKNEKISYEEAIGGVYRRSRTLNPDGRVHPIHRWQQWGWRWRWNWRRRRDEHPRWHGDWDRNGARLGLRWGWLSRHGNGRNRLWHGPRLGRGQGHLR